MNKTFGDKVLPAILFWGLLILMGWYFMKNDDSYLIDPYWPDEGADVHIYR